MAFIFINTDLSKSMKEFKKTILEYDTVGQKVFVICNNPQIILDLIEDGNEIETLILGGTDVPENTESVKISKRAYVKKSDEPVFKKIMEKGTKIFVQYVPNDKPAHTGRTHRRDHF